MQKLKIVALLSLTILLCQCKSTAPTGPGTGDRQLTDVTKILRITGAKFLYFDSISPGNPKQSIQQTRDWLITQPNVGSAETLDSIYIYIELTSGLQTTFSFNEVTPDGYSVFRGGNPSSAGVRLNATGKPSANKIDNPNVLIYAAGYSEFYKPGEMEKITALLAKSGLVNTTLLKDDQCTYQTIQSFKDYGLVILDTHGQEDAFWVGTKIDTALGGDETILKANITAAAGPSAYGLIQTNILRLEDNYNYKDVVVNGEKHSVASLYYKLFATSKFLDMVANMPGTVVFGNFCYSGFTGPIRDGKNFGNTPIGAAFNNKLPISYYGFAFDSKRSTTVDDVFAKEMEDSLIRALLIRGDSTGIAHLNSTGGNFFDEGLARYQGSSYPHLNFVHFGADNYDYEFCPTVFTDNRDGIIYKAVCIGNQTWMAENLRYNAPGSDCYDSIPGNCDIYGRLYPWTVAMAGASASDAVPSGVQGICPKGWHLPSAGEWTILINQIGGYSMGGNLKATSALWSPPNAQATNSTGFSALPGGQFTVGKSDKILVRLFGALGIFSNFQSTSVDPSDNSVKAFGLTNTSGAVNTFRSDNPEDPNQPTSNIPCRCIMDK